MIFLRSFIGKFVYSLARPVFWRKEISWHLSEILFILPVSLFVGDFSFIRGYKKHGCICLEFDKACFYCPSGLDIIGYSNKDL